MLQELIVKNFILLEDLKITFKAGLTVLTGETGAGKSILIDIIGLILGNRIDNNFRRKKDKEASVTASFHIEDNHPVVACMKKYNIHYGSELIIRREIKTDGKSKCFINDTLVTQNLLSEISDNLIEIQGQFEDRGLLNPNTHLNHLDTFANHDHLIKNFKKIYKEKIRLEEVILKSEVESKKKKENDNWIREAHEQLVFLNPKFGEETELEKSKKILINKEKIYNAINQTKEIIEQENGLEDLINKIMKILDNAKSFNFENINQATEIANTTKANIDELKNVVNSTNADISENFQNLDVIDDRLYELRSQARKHNCNVNDLIRIKEEFSLKIEDVDDNNNKFQELKNKLKTINDKLIHSGILLSESRKKAAIELTKKINDELPLLKFENAKFDVEFNEFNLENILNNGFDKVLFLATTNSGTTSLPISKIASGGELSRFLLAIKVVLEAVIQKRTIIFDEIDTGIGGAAANAVGVRLSKLGKVYQTIAVTHSPQVSSNGDYHYLVNKTTYQNKTTTNVKELNQTERIEEIARMLSGKSITKEARNAALKLLDNI